jgi:hypothetical protein
MLHAPISGRAPTSQAERRSGEVERRGGAERRSGDEERRGGGEAARGLALGIGCRSCKEITAGIREAYKGREARNHRFRSQIRGTTLAVGLVPLVFPRSSSP